MAAEGVIGVDVVIKLDLGGGSSLLLGQRDAKMTSTREKINMSTKANWPGNVYKYGWHDASIDCDGLLQAGGAGGIATLINKQLEGLIVPAIVEVGDTGETLVGDFLLSEVSLASPHTAEGTMTCKLEKSGVLLATEGS